MDYGTAMVIDRVTIFCFGASYAVALFLEVLERLRPQSIWRWLKLVAGGAGLFAHTLYLYFHALDVPGGTNTLLALSWIVAIFLFVRRTALSAQRLGLVRGAARDRLGAFGSRGQKYGHSSCTE